MDDLDLFLCECYKIDPVDGSCDLDCPNRLKECTGGNYDHCNCYKPKLNKPNRIKSTAPKKDKFWCYSCDMQLVGEYSKCPVCGHRNGKKRLKK